MARFVSREPVRVQIEGSEEWVEIKPKLSRGDKERFRDMLFERPSIAQPLKAKTLFGYGTMLLAMSIVNWNLIDEATGQPVPYDAENVKAVLDSLDEDAMNPLFDKVAEEVAVRNPTLAGRDATSG